jgi:succinate-semialdehyde dehydrogenase / glutarate-semialdehyde dehydrogenase
MNLKDPSLLHQHCYVDGAWIGAAGGATIAVTNPATGEQLGTVPALGTAETEAAVAAAHAAFPAWGRRRRRSAPSCCAAGTT